VIKVAFGWYCEISVAADCGKGARDGCIAGLPVIEAEDDDIAPPAMIPGKGVT
jgi:hypothetical protein